MPKDDLWPADLAPRDLRPPAAILHEQAVLLAPRTKNALIGEVRSSVTGRYFIHDLFVVAPRLEGYEHKLLRVRHDVGLYPVDLQTTMAGAGTGTARDEGAFVELVASVLRSDGVARVLRALLAQSSSPESFSGDATEGQ